MSALDVKARSAYWERFRRQVLEEADLRHRLLATPSERTAFLEGMVRLSAEIGCPLSQEELEAVEIVAGLGNNASFPGTARTPQDRQPERKGALSDRPVTDTRLLKDWIPAGVGWAQGEPYLDWFDPGDRRFTDPFFEDTVRRCRCHPFYGWFRLRTPLNALESWADHPAEVPLTGFIFHLSRCGSTLVTQMLAALDRHRVLSEPEPIDSVLRAHFQDPTLPQERQARWLRGMVSALGQRRHAGERHLFIKFDSWHAGFLPLIRRTFPEVPWCFVYRDPVEILVSHRHKPGLQMVPGLVDSALFGMDAASARAMPQEEYRAGVLAAIGVAAIRQHRGDPGLLLNYRQLPDAVPTTLARWFHLDLSAEEDAAMRAASRYHAKQPQVAFADDTEAKQREGQAMVGPAARQRLLPLYTELETLRLSAAGWG